MSTLALKPHLQLKPTLRLGIGVDEGGAGPSDLESIALAEIMQGRTFQRMVNSDGTFETFTLVPVSGTTVGQATAIQAQVLLAADDTPVTSWVVVDASPAPTSFSGALAVPQGGPYKVRVRDAAQTSIGAEGTTTWKIGLLAIGLDQSNMGGMFSTFNVSPPPLDPLGGWFDENNLVWTNTPNGNGVRELMNGFVAGAGVPVALGNPTVGGQPMSYFIEGQPGWDGQSTPGQPDYRVGVQPLIEMMGGDIEIVFLRGGEGEANAMGPSPLEKKNMFKNDTLTVIGQIEALVGHPVTVIMGSVMTTTVVGGTTDASWTAMDAAVYELSVQQERFILSTSTKDGQRIDEYHADGTSYGQVGQRFAQSLLVHNGDATAEPAWHISAAEIVDATHTRIALIHSMGDDFTPSANITAFQVSGNNGASWIDAVGAREDATHILLTHASIVTSNNRQIRFQYGMLLPFDPEDPLKNPIVSEMVFDNSYLPSPLFPSADRSIIAPGFAADPTPTWIQVLPGLGAGNGGSGIDQQWTGIDLSAAVGTKLHLSFVRFDEGTFADVSSVTVTPFGGSPTVFTPIAITGDDGTGTERWAGITDVIPAVSGLDNCTIDLHYTSNPFQGTFLALWSVPEDVEVVAAVYAADVVVPPAPYVSSVELETQAGGFICASYAPLPATDTESGSLIATWGGDTPDPAMRFSYDSFFRNQRSAADVSGTAAAINTAITATFPGIDDVSSYRLLAVSFR